tara:strand:- start:141 stop:362 length:222 start_codon:yes stop_codon:yes gene_type:complete
VEQEAGHSRKGEDEADREADVPSPRSQMKADSPEEISENSNITLSDDIGALLSIELSPSLDLTERVIKLYSPN